MLIYLIEEIELVRMRLMEIQQAFDHLGNIIDNYQTILKEVETQIYENRRRAIKKGGE